MHKYRSTAGPTKKLAHKSASVHVTLRSVTQLKDTWKKKRTTRNGKEKKRIPDKLKKSEEERKEKNNNNKKTAQQCEI